MCWISAWSNRNRPIALGELHHQRGVGGRFELLEQVVFVDLGDRSHDVEIELAPDHRRAPERTRVVSSPSRSTLRRTISRTEPGSPTTSRSIVRTYWPLLVQRDRAGLVEVAEQLTGEEGVAVGLLVHRAGERDAVLLHLVPGGAFHQSEDLTIVEPTQRDPCRDVRFRRMSARNDVSGCSRGHHCRGTCR